MRCSVGGSRRCCSRSGTQSRYAPVVALVGRNCLCAHLRVFGSTVGASIRSRQRRRRARARLGRRRAGRRADRLRDRVGARRDGAAAARPEPTCVARCSARYVLQQLNEIVPPRLAAERARPDRPVPELRRAAAADRAARPARARTARRARGRRRASCACSARPAGSASRAAAGSRPTGCVVTAAHVVAGEEDTQVVTLHDGVAARRRRWLRPARRRRRAARRRARAPPAAARRSEARHAGRDRRLPAERAARRECRADRRDRDRVRRRTRTAAGGDAPSSVTSLSGTVQPRQLRRPGAWTPRAPSSRPSSPPGRGRRRLRRARPRSCGATSPRAVAPVSTGPCVR